MAIRISHIPFYQRLMIADKWLIAFAVIYAVPVALLIIWKPLFGIVAATVPLAFFIVGYGPAALYALILATFVFIPITGEVSILPADLAALTLIAAHFVDLLLNPPARQNNRLALAYRLYLLVLFIALALEGFTSLSIRYFVRQLVLAGAFFAVFHFGRRVQVRDLLNFFLVAAALNSAYSLYQFLQVGGGVRTFGLAGLGFGDHAMVAIIIGAVFYLWSRDVRTRILYGIMILVIVGALATTQTRASAITAGWGLIIAIVLSLLAARRTGNRLPHKNLFMAIVVALLIIPILAFYTPIFEGVIYRFGRLGFQASGTILLRVSLWKAALGAFWENPIFGIGPGNFPMVIDWVPEVRFDYIFFLVSGLSTHSVLMTTLAETGLMGLATLTFFYWKAFFKARDNFQNTVNDSNLPVNIILFIATLAIIGSSLYAGSWFWGNNSYHMAIIFGLTAASR